MGEYFIGAVRRMLFGSQILIARRGDSYFMLTVFFLICICCWPWLEKMYGFKGAYYTSMAAALCLCLYCL